MDLGSMSRLIFLAAQYKPILPSLKIMKLVPQSDLLLAIVKDGLVGAAKDLDIALVQLQRLCDEGSENGKGDEKEFRIVLSQVAMTQLDIHREDYTMTNYLDMMGEISRYSTGEVKKLFSTEEVDLVNENGDVVTIPKWNSGMEPLDHIVGGLYQGILTLIGRPGHGKTSFLLTIMEEMVKNESASGVWFYEQEIPREMMAYRVSPVAQRTHFRKGCDRLICGFVPLDKMMEEIHDHPDPNRVVIIDSPDVMVGGVGEGKRFAIEEIYMGLISMKMKCKMILVSSWPRRKDTHISLESGAEAWAKAWYSDIIVGMVKMGRVSGGFTKVHLNTPKNRFGPSDRDLNFHYNYGDLTWQMPGEYLKDMEEGDW